MFTIKKLTLDGFKSFSDFTEINLSHKGITAIIGPNGCGKSNIADAISWVIGEQRVRLLRGGKMLDVISQGSKYRDPAGYAEIVLELSPKDDLQYQHQSSQPLRVGRRLYRNGDSEYLINNRICRLKDVQSLFAGTGLGNNHYAIIEQGKVGQILSAKPQEQRSLLEEAAEVSGFRQRQHSAELKLDNSRQNLLRLLDIISEIEKQEVSLKRQASRSRRYRELQSKLREILNIYYLSSYRLSCSKTSSLSLKVQGLKQKENGETERINELEERLLYLEEKRYRTEGILGQQKASLSENELSLERSAQIAKQTDQQTTTLKNRLHELELETTPVSNRITKLLNEKQGTHESSQLIEQTISSESGHLTIEESKLQEEISIDYSIERVISELRAKQYNLTAQAERDKYLQKQLEDSLNHHIKRQQSLSLEKERASSPLLSNLRSASELMLQVQDKTQELDLLLSKQQQLQQKTATISTQKNKLQSQADQTSETVAKLNIRLNFLNEINRKRSYFSQAVQGLLRYDNLFNLSGTLSDSIQTAPDIETLLETTFYPELQCLIASPLTDLNEAIEFLKSNDAGTATFLFPDTHNQNPSLSIPAGSDSLLRQLNLPAEIEQVVIQCIPQLAQAIICSTLSEAITQSAIQTDRVFVTRDGEKVIAGQLITGGTLKNENFKILSLKREAQELAEKAHELSTSYQEFASNLAQYEAELDELTQLQRETDESIRNLRQEIAVLNQEHKFLEQETSRIKSHLQIIETELQQIKKDRVETEEKLATTINDKANVEAHLNLTSSEIIETENKLTQSRKQTEERKAALSTKRSDFAALLEKRRSLQSELRRIESELESLQNRVQAIELTKIEVSTKLSENTITIQTAEQQYLELQETRLELQKQLEEQNQEFNSLRQLTSTTQENLRSLRQEYDSDRETRSQLEIELTKTETQTEHLIKMYETELGGDLTVIEAELIPDDFNTAEAETQITELRKSIQNLGTVNLAALEELDEVTERLGFLYSQREDIEKAIAETQASITEIKKHTKDKFLTAFRVINENFTETFRHLFGGGHAEIRLIDSEDVLESGVEIIAQPPGKRLQNILLLSGGEKAMSALALIIAIFKFRPSPFCLLDEVDAPLDDANIGKLADIITEMSRDTQFLVITHSKKTMEAANMIYGVTMETPGVSSVVSVQLS